MRGITRKADDLFRLAKGADLEKRFRVMEELGGVVGGQHTGQFEALVRETVRSGTVDVSGWSRDAVRVLLVVADEREMHVTFKNGDMFATPVKYPEGAMVNLFAKRIASREWQNVRLPEDILEQK